MIVRDLPISIVDALRVGYEVRGIVSRVMDADRVQSPELPDVEDGPQLDAAPFALADIVLDLAPLSLWFTRSVTVWISNGFDGQGLQLNRLLIGVVLPFIVILAGLSLTVSNLLPVLVVDQYVVTVTSE